MWLLQSEHIKNWDPDLKKLQELLKSDAAIPEVKQGDHRPISLTFWHIMPGTEQIEQYLHRVV